LAEELEQLEELIVSAFNGTYQKFQRMPNSGGPAVLTFKLAWNQGQWEFLLQNQETLVVRAGTENQLGWAGGYLFGTGGRKVNLNDFRINIGEK